MIKKILFVIFVLASLVLASCASGKGAEAASTLMPVPAEYAGRVNPLGQDAAVEGAKIFSNNCKTCHGPEGHGDGPASAALDPQPQNLAELQSTAGDDYLYWRINTGKEGTSMIGWQGILTEEQIWQVVAHINTLK